MARNGLGTYSLPTGNPVVTGTSISSTVMNTTLSDVASALTGSLAANGETPVTANLQMDNFKLTGLASGSARTDSSNVGNVQDGVINWIAGGGTADAITANYSPAITALVDGQMCYVRATAANATTTPTFSPNSLTAHTITKKGGVALVAGNIYGVGHELELRYNLANTRWELLNPNTAVDATTGNVTGNVTGVVTGALNSTQEIIASATTPDIFNATSSVISYTGTANCTGFVAAPQAGVQRTLICAGACLFTAGANLLIEGINSGNTITLGVNAIVNVVALTTTQFKITYSYSGTFIATGTGFTVAPTATASFTVTNGMVHLKIPASSMTGVSNANTFTVTGLPSSIIYTTGGGMPVQFGVDNGANVYNVGGSLAVGTMKFTLNGSLTGWTTSGTKTLVSTDFFYNLN